MVGERNPSVSASPIHLPLRTDPPCGAPVFRSAYFPKKLSSFSPKRSTSRFASLTLRAHRGGIQYAVSLAPLACQGELSAQQTEGLLVPPTQKRKGFVPSFLFYAKSFHASGAISSTARGRQRISARVRCPAHSPSAVHSAGSSKSMLTCPAEKK